ncbi:hypothetical protein O6H91_04G049600 [Diphasiastrum complanatum]|uniref:Uncharacterized protein n=1 Tax=Diphasiastrum complanatum TaxID=34168 RepID=A0ACC2DXB5_DIPCM|nr:hypothetical protein O6H91_04G049600 [Diphasiastrum complanatum]
MGKHLGEGPSLQSLMQRSHLRKGHRPRTINDTVNSSTFSTPMYHQPADHVEGDAETLRRKCRPYTSFVVDDNVSHRPEYNYNNVQRGRCGRPKKINFDTYHTATKVQADGGVVAEQEVHKSQWAIRRTPPNSKVKCLGMVPGQGLCSRPIPSCARGGSSPIILWL